MVLSIVFIIIAVLVVVLMLLDSSSLNKQLAADSKAREIAIRNSILSTQKPVTTQAPVVVKPATVKIAIAKKATVKVSPTKAKVSAKKKTTK
jgi:P pilus assembly chaperone PapD